MKHIEQQLQKLDPNWYKATRARFEKETFYDSEKDMIDDVVKEDNQKIIGEVNDNGYKYPKTEFVDKDIIIKQEFKEYAWRRKLEYTHFPNEHYPEIVDGKHVIRTIINYIKEDVEKFMGVNTYMYIRKVILKMDEMFSVHLKNGSTTQEYVYVLDYVKNEFIRLIKRDKELNGAKVEYEVSQINSLPRLEFDLQLKEVAALIFLLKEAKILKCSNPQDNLYIEMAAEQFYFSNQNKDNKSTQCSNISKTYNELKGKMAKDNTPSAVKKVANKLDKVISKYSY